MRPFDEVNLARKALLPGEQWEAYHDTVGFSRLFGTVVADVVLATALLFCDREVMPDGSPVDNDEKLRSLPYRVVGSVKKSVLPTGGEEFLADPGLPQRTIFEIPAGRWLKVIVRNVDDKPLTMSEVHFRASVF